MPRTPFTFEDCRLPHYVSPCGYHSPRYLDQDAAKKAIELAFREAGYRLMPRYPIERDGVTCIADGYDPVHRVGYIYAAVDSLDWDAFVTYPHDPAFISPSNADWLLREFVWRAEADRDEELGRKLRSIGSLPLLAERAASLRRLASKDLPYRLSLAEAKKLINRAEESGQFIAVVSHFDLRFAVPSWQEDGTDGADAVDLIPDRVKRERLAAMIEERMVRRTADQLRRTVHDYIAWARSRGLQ
ncbi:MAG TPA: hypothetical protein VMV10_29910 [Pirellulales bacterium]|nr:hypothetical protein [Pirellulales bacterium]